MNTTIKNYLIQTLNDMLKLKQDIPMDENLLGYGLNSIKLIKLISLLKKENIHVSFLEMIKNPTLNAWIPLCEQNYKSNSATEINKTTNQTRRFEMTPMQKAYLWGRNKEQPLGGVSCHAYVEFNPDNILDIEKLNASWKMLFTKHPVLRTKFFSDGTQQITDLHSACENFTIYDLRNLDIQKTEKRLDEIRQERSHKMLNVENAEVIELAISLIDDNHMRLHLDIDLLVADVISFKIILDDFTDLYLDKTTAEPSDWNFCNYLSICKKSESKFYKKDKKFWESKLSTLTPGSSLPLALQPEALSGAKYKRYQFSICNMDYIKLKNIVSKKETTIAMVLLTLYSLILSRWSGNKNLLINIPLFNRDLSIKGTDTAVADFTSLILLDVTINDALSLFEQSKKIQENFYECYNHSSFDGIEVQKLLATSAGNTIIAPIVFSCTEGMEQFSSKCSQLLGKPGYIITQTPQVYIDFQTFQENDDLVCIWDIPVGLFHDGMINEMFKTLEKGVRLLIDFNRDLSSKELDSIFSNTIETSSLHVNYSNYIIDDYLFSGFYKNITVLPDKTALIDAETDKHYCYYELGQMVSFMAKKLINAGVKQNSRIAITVDRGVKEIVSILAVLFAGACYIPITPNQPEKRRHDALKTMDVTFILTDEENLDKIPAEAAIIKFEYGISENIIKPIMISNTSSAYIILTSGTTGLPKGVEIAHNAAMNTIRDVNNRIAYTENDSILAISSIDFDLSVYDIFGTLTNGGTLVVIGKEHYRDAEFWKNTVEKYNISIWNSVPLLFDMLLTVSEQTDYKLPLRTVMLSGDWISSSLYERLMKLNPSCRFIGMGGATEASIWSNWYEVKNNNDIRGKFIPYGWPLKNQGYRILDSYFRDCPHWAVGELLICGNGLAIGYCKDEAKTNDKFIEMDGKRWYRTGDKGYFEPDGCIKFLGRIDQQCKVRGHRIEVEEIEKHLEEYFHIKNAICWPAGTHENFNHLEACIFNSGKKLSKEQMNSAIEYLRQRLPPYMIPTVIYSEDTLPLTANGKIDRKKVRSMFTNTNAYHLKECKKQETQHYSLIVSKLKKIWCDNLNIPDASEDDNYYFSGGDSLKAIKLSSSINKTFNLSLSTSEILEAQTLGEISKKIYDIKQQLTLGGLKE